MPPKVRCNSACWSVCVQEHKVIRARECRSELGCVLGKQIHGGLLDRSSHAMATSTLLYKNGTQERGRH
eukprot:1153084-Pelagomonas_calceolata.AAC.10